MASDEEVRRAVRNGTDPASRPTARQVEAISSLTYDSHSVETIKRMLKRRLDPTAYVTSETEHTMLMLRDCLFTASDEFVAYVKGSLQPLVSKFYSKNGTGDLRGVHQAAGSLLAILRDEELLTRERRLHRPIRTNRIQMRPNRNMAEMEPLSPSNATKTLPMTPPDTPSLRLPRERRLSLKADRPLPGASPTPRTTGLPTPKPSPAEQQSQLAPVASHVSVTSTSDVKSTLVEDKIRMVTANTPPLITTNQMEEVAQLTYDSSEREVVQWVIDMRLNALKSQPAYHHLIKTLTLVHHCLFYASDEFVDFCRQRKGSFEKLCTFPCPSSDVRSRAESVLDRLKDERKLQRERQSRKALRNSRRTFSDPSTLSEVLPVSPTIQPPDKRYSLQDGDLDTVPVVEKIGDHAIGYGGYSDVWKGKMTTDHGVTYKLVAVKILRLNATPGADPDRLHKRLEREVLVWQRLDHESIAEFHGVVYGTNKSPAIISSWYENGSADDYLQKSPNVNPLKTLWEIVLGVEYLHASGIVHGDLKGGNVMIDEYGHAKLIDFGLSRLIDSVSGASGLTTSSVAFSIRWCAPELVKYDDAQTTKATDVYAFASTILQLLTGEVPYNSLKERAVLVTVFRGVTPRRMSRGFPPNFNGADQVWSLLESCWKDAPLRPSISEVKERMGTLYH